MKRHRVMFHLVLWLVYLSAISTIQGRPTEGDEIAVESQTDNTWSFEEESDWEWSESSSSSSSDSWSDQSQSESSSWDETSESASNTKQSDFDFDNNGFDTNESKKSSKHSQHSSSDYNESKTNEEKDSEYNRKSESKGRHKTKSSKGSQDADNSSGSRKRSSSIIDQEENETYSTDEEHKRSSDKRSHQEKHTHKSSSKSDEIEESDKRGHGHKGKGGKDKKHGHGKTGHKGKGGKDDDETKHGHGQKGHKGKGGKDDDDDKKKHGHGHKGGKEDKDKKKHSHGDVGHKGKGGHHEHHDDENKKKHGHGHKGGKGDDDDEKHGHEHKGHKGNGGKDDDDDKKKRGHKGHKEKGGKDDDDGKKKHGHGHKGKGGKDDDDKKKHGHGDVGHKGKGGHHEHHDDEDEKKHGHGHKGHKEGKHDELDKKHQHGHGHKGHKEGKHDEHDKKHEHGHKGHKGKGGKDDHDKKKHGHGDVGHKGKGGHHDDDDKKKHGHGHKGGKDDEHDNKKKHGHKGKGGKDDDKKKHGHGHKGKDDHDKKKHGHGDVGHKGKGGKDDDDNKKKHGHGHKDHKGKGGKDDDDDKKKHGHGHKGHKGKGGKDDDDGKKKHGHGDVGHKGKGGHYDDDDKNKHGHGHKGGKDDEHDEKHEHGHKGHKGKGGKDGDDDKNKHGHGHKGKGGKDDDDDQKKHGHGKKGTGKDKHHGSGEKPVKKHSKCSKHKGGKKHPKGPDTTDSTEESVHSSRNKKHSKHSVINSFDDYSSDEEETSYIRRYHNSNYYTDDESESFISEVEFVERDQESADDEDRRRKPEHKHNKKGWTKRTNRKHKNDHPRGPEEDDDSVEYRKEWHTTKHKSTKSDNDDSSDDWDVEETKKHKRKGKHGKRDRPGHKGGKPKPSESPRKLPGHKTKPRDRKETHHTKKDRNEKKNKHNKDKKDKKRGHKNKKGRKHHGSSDDDDWQTVVKRRSKKDSDNSSYQSSEEYDSFEDEETRIRRRQRHGHKNRHTNSKDVEDSDDTQESQHGRKWHKTKTDKKKPKHDSDKPRKDHPRKKPKKPNQDTKGKKHPTRKPKGNKTKPGKDTKTRRNTKHTKKEIHNKNEKYDTEESEDSYHYTSDEVDSSRKYDGKRIHKKRTYNYSNKNGSDNESEDQPDNGEKEKPKDENKRRKPKDRSPRGRPGDKGKPDNKKPERPGKKPKHTDKNTPKKHDDESDEDDKNNKPERDHDKPKDKKHRKKKGHLKERVFKHVKKWNKRHSSEEQNDFEWFFTSRRRDRSSYKKRHTFLKDLTFKDVKKPKIQKKFYSFFHFYPETEDLFDLVRFCYQYPEKPANFEINFKTTLENFFDEEELRLSTDILSIFLNNLFDKGRDNVRSNYRIRYQFLKRLTYKEAQKPQNRKRFYFFFEFYPDNEDVFNFLKFCFHFSKKPVNFEENFKAVVQILEESDSLEITDEIYSVYLKNLHGKGRSNNRRDYKTKHQFLKDLTFEDVQSYQTKEMFYFYFHLYPKTESIFDFIKFCFTEDKKPANFDINFKAAIREFRDSDSEDISDEIYSIYLKNLFGKGKDNKRNNNNKIRKDYKTIFQFIKNLTYRDVQKGQNRKKFYAFFRFYPETEEIFRFVKFCYRYPKKPVNFDENFKAVVRILLESDSLEITEDVYSVFLKNLHGKGRDNNRRDYKTKYQFLRELTFSDVQKSEKKELFYFYFDVYPKTESIFDFIKFCFTEDQKPVNFDENFKVAIKAILELDSPEVSDDIYSIFLRNLFGKGQDNNRRDYKTQYAFLKDLTFEDLHDYESRELFYFYFRIYPDTESVFEFIKFCFSFDTKPVNFDKNFKAAINLLQDSESFEFSDEIYSVFLKNLFGKGKDNNIKDYVTKYKFLKDLTFEKVQSYEDRELFYFYFHFFPETEELFNFIKFCFHYEHKPKNFDSNFKAVISILEESDYQEDSDYYYSIFLKNLFGKGRDNNRKDYISIHKFLSSLTFQNCQSYEYKETFYFYFGIYPETEELFNFFKFCLRFSVKPANFDVNIKAAIDALKDSSSHEVTEEIYTLFLTNLFGDNTQNGDNDYLTKHEFLKDLTYQEVQKKENWHLFFALFQFYPENESIFSYTKFCYQYAFKPANFETNFQASIDFYLNSNTEVISNEIYKIFTNDLFDFSNQNYGGNYDAKHQFLQSLTYEDVRSTENWNTFYSHFGIYPEKQSWFDFVKDCFQYDQKPLNFDFNFDAALSVIFSNSLEVDDNAITIFKHNLFGEDGHNHQIAGQNDFNVLFTDYFTFDNSGVYDEFFSRYPYLNWNHYVGTNDNQNNQNNNQNTYNYNYGNNGDNQNGYSYSYTYGNDGNNQYNYNYNNGNENNNGYNYNYNNGNENNNGYNYNYNYGNQDNNGYNYNYGNQDNGNNNNAYAYNYNYGNQDNQNNQYSYNNENQGNNGQTWSRTWHYP